MIVIDIDVGEPRHEVAMKCGGASAAKSISIDADRTIARSNPWFSNLRHKSWRNIMSLPSDSGPSGRIVCLSKSMDIVI